jgi:hypothetical protein
MTDRTDYGCHVITIDPLYTIAVSYPSPGQAEHMHMEVHDNRRRYLNLRCLLGAIEEAAWIEGELEYFRTYTYSENELDRGVDEADAWHVDWLHERLVEVRSASV